MSTLSERLSKIQVELKAPKNQYNNFGKYKYRSQEDILEAVKPLLNGLVITLSDDVKIIQERIYITTTATITDGKDSISVNALAREPLTQKGMSDSQVTVSTSSYARKTALNGLLCLDDTKDTDSQDNTTVSAMETIRKLLKETKTDEQEFLKYFKTNAVSQLNYENQQKAIQMLEKKKGVKK